MINDMKPGEVRKMPDGTLIEFVHIENIASLDNPCYGCAYEFTDCAANLVHLGGCDGLNRDDGLFGIFLIKREHE